MDSILERFWSKVDKTPGHGPWGNCWLWTAGKRSGNYGGFKLNGKATLAHRTAYEFKHGIELSKEQTVCHSCDNPSCVNDNHLFLGTQLDNVTDMWNKNRAKVPDLRKVSPIPDHEWCGDCQDFLPVERFYKCKSRWNGVQKKCKTCKKARDKRRNHARK